MSYQNLLRSFKYQHLLTFQILMLDKPIHFQLLRFFSSHLWGKGSAEDRDRKSHPRGGFVAGWRSSTVDGETKIWRWQPTTWHVFQNLVKPGKSWDNFTISTGADGFLFSIKVWSCDHDPFELVQSRILYQKMESIFGQVSKKHLE